MAGIQNNIFFSQGLKLEISTAADIIDMQTISTDVSIINYSGDPEGNISANPSSVCHDPLSGNLYVKQTGTGNTGWSSFIPLASLIGQDGISVTTTMGVTTITPRGVGINNMFLGEGAGNLTLSGSYNNGYGAGSLSALTNGTEFSSFGHNSLEFTTGGGYCVAIGNQTLQSCAAPTQSVAIGFSSMFESSICDANVCIGSYSGRSMSTTNNVAIGYGAMSGSGKAGGGSGVGIGTNALAAIDTGVQNFAGGLDSLINLVSGSYNVAIGASSGSSYNGAESSNILILNNGVNGESNTVRIGNQGSGAASQNNCYIAGITGVTIPAGAAVLCDSNGHLGTILSSLKYKHSVKEIKEDVSILDLKPVSFIYKTTSTKSYGLIAEDVDRKFPDLCIYNDAGEPESIKYHEMPALLLNEIKKLNERIQILEAKI